MKSKTIQLIIIFAFVILQNGFSQLPEISLIGDSTYQIKLNEKEQKDNFVWSKLPDTWDNASTIFVKHTIDTFKLASNHPIVCAESGKFKQYFSSRAVALQGAINFRDLGGYATKDGRQVKWGKIFRSADISKLTGKDLEILLELNLKLVCDLRGQKEDEAAPDRIPAGVDRILLPAGSENIVPGAAGYMKYLKNENTTDSLIMSLYTNIGCFGNKFKPVFDRLLSLEKDKSLMVHCTAGKDRTGICSALILYALGVDEPAIYADYEATNLYRKEENEKNIHAMAGVGIPESAARKLMAADPDYLKLTFDSIESEYQTVDNFLKKVMELDAKKKEELKRKFLY